MSQPTPLRSLLAHAPLAALCALAVALPATAAVSEGSCPPAPLTRAGLDSLKSSGFEVDGDEERNRLALQLLAYLGDPDPEVRDGIVYEATSKWLRAGRLETATVRAMAMRLRPLLEAAGDTDGFRKPFAALVLSEVARADRIEPVLTAPERAAIVDAATRYLEGVRDHRGFDPDEGWRHGVAHGADLVLQLGLNPEVSPEQLRRLLVAVASQVAPPGAVFYTFGEPERLARAVDWIHRRSALADAEWDRWLASIGDPAPLASWSGAYASLEGLARRHDTLAFLHALGFAARSRGDEAGARLASLIDREILRVSGG